MSTQSAGNQLPPHAQVIQMATGLWISRALHVVAQFGIADLLADGPKSSEELAQATESHAPSLYRLLRAAASLGLFTEIPPGTFQLSPLGASLQTGAPGAARSTILALAGKWSWAIWSEFPYSVETGKAGTEKALGESLFDFLGKHPEEAGYFNDAMIGFHGQEPQAVAAAFDFSDVGKLVDVGGGTGTLLMAVLRAHPESLGILYDLPHVTAEASRHVEEMGLARRCEVRAGSFFQSVPAGDAYILSHIIHDWDEARCLTILGNCRQANPKARVLIVEMVIPSGDAPHPGKIFDLVMLVVTGGQERTEGEYRDLLGKAGYKLGQVVATESPVSVIEGIPA